MLHDSSLITQSLFVFFNGYKPLTVDILVNKICRSLGLFIHILVRRQRQKLLHNVAVEVTHAKYPCQYLLP